MKPAVELQQILLFIGDLPLNRDYSYGGKSSMLAGHGDIKVDEEAQTVSYGTCVAVAAKGCSLDVFVRTGESEEPMDHFEVKVPKTKRYNLFAATATSLRNTGAEISVSGLFWSSTGSRSNVINVEYRLDPALSARVRIERDAKNKIERDAKEKKEREEQQEKKRQQEAADFEAALQRAKQEKENKIASNAAAIEELKIKLQQLEADNAHLKKLDSAAQQVSEPSDKTKKRSREPADESVSKRRKRSAAA